MWTELQIDWHKNSVSIYGTMIKQGSTKHSLQNQLMLKNLHQEHDMVGKQKMCGLCQATYLSMICEGLLYVHGMMLLHYQNK